MFFKMLGMGTFLYLLRNVWIIDFCSSVSGTHTQKPKNIKDTEGVLNFKKEMYPLGCIHMENREELWHFADISVIIWFLHYTEEALVDQVIKQEKRSFLPVHIYNAYMQMVNSIFSFSKSIPHWKGGEREQCQSQRLSE